MHKKIIAILLLFILLNTYQFYSSSSNVIFLTSKKAPLLIWYEKNSSNVMYYLIPYEIEEKWLPFFDPYFLIKNTSLTKSNLVDQLFQNIQGINYLFVISIMNSSKELFEALDSVYFLNINKTRLENLINKLGNIINKTIETSYPITLTILNLNNALINYNNILKELENYIKNTQNINFEKIQNYKNSLENFYFDNILPILNYFYIKFINTNVTENFINIDNKILGKSIEYKFTHANIYIRLYNYTINEEFDNISFKLDLYSFVLNMLIKLNYNFNLIKKLNITNYFKSFLIIKIYIGIIFNKEIIEIEKMIENDIKLLNNKEIIYESGNIIFPPFDYITKMNSTYLIFYPQNKQITTSNITIPEKQFYYDNQGNIKEFKTDRYAMIKNGVFSLNVIIPYNEDVKYFNINIIGGFKKDITEEATYSLKISYLPQYEIKMKTSDSRPYSEYINKLVIILLILTLIFLYVIVINRYFKIKIKGKKI